MLHLQIVPPIDGLHSWHDLRQLSIMCSLNMLLTLREMLQKLDWDNKSQSTFFHI